MRFRVRPRNGRAIIEKKRRGKAPRREVDNTMRLENGRFLMQVEEKGAEITSLYDKAREKELIWDGDPAFWARHAPILFPHVGRTFEDVLRIGNRQYASTQHGFARDRVFKADKLGDGQARFTLRHDEETLKKYPFPFVLSVTYTLHPSDVTVQWKVENPGQEDMPFTIGGHPAFAQRGQGSRRLRLVVPGKNGTCLPSAGPRQRYSPSGQKLPTTPGKRSVAVTQHRV